MSKKVTVISELASLLFLDKMKVKTKEAIEKNDFNYFDGDGVHVIENCFFAVLDSYKDGPDMEQWFRNYFENMGPESRFAWPNNKYFGNYMKYMHQEYARDVVTNLTTHDKSRLTHFIKLMAFEENHFVPQNQLGQFDEIDIKNAVSLAIEGYEHPSIRGDVLRLRKRNQLLQYVSDIGGPADGNVRRFTKNHWFKSLPMWLEMQTKIDNYHKWAEAYRSIVDYALPVIKNLCVIPKCHHLRKSVRMDGDILYRMLCETGLITRDEYGRQHLVGFVTQHKEHYFNEVFDMEKINRVLKANKQFHYQIMCNGVSASILYTVKKKTIVQNDDLVRKRYDEGFYVYELGLDPGMKCWNATVRRTIKSGKEVRYIFVLFSILFLVCDCTVTFHCVNHFIV